MKLILDLRPSDWVELETDIYHLTGFNTSLELRKSQETFGYVVVGGFFDDHIEPVMFSMLVDHYVATDIGVMHRVANFILKYASDHYAPKLMGVPEE